MFERFALPALILASVLPLLAASSTPTHPPPFATSSSPADASVGEHLVILQPGYPGSTKEAEKFVRELCAHAGKESGLTGEYHNTEKEGLEAIRQRRAAIGIVSLGIYLKHRRALGLTSLLWSRPSAPFHVLVRRGTSKTLEELSGKSVTGTPFLEPEFVNRLLFDSTPKTPARGGQSRLPEWKPHPVKYFSRAVRALKKGRRDAALLSDLEYQGLKRLETAKEFEVIHVTPRFPAAVVVRIGGAAVPDPLAGFVEALEAMHATEPGRKLLKTMGIGGFEPIDDKRLEAWMREYEEDAPKDDESAKEKKKG